MHFINLQVRFSNIDDTLISNIDRTLSSNIDDILM